jgi:hypothetical protein
MPIGGVKVDDREVRKAGRYAVRPQEGRDGKLIYLSS